MINRSYPGQIDLCWPDSLNIRRLQLSTAPRFSWGGQLITWQHWCRCPELYLQLGRVRFSVLLPAGLLPSWAPRFVRTW